MAAARQFCDAAKSKSLSACFRTAFVRRSPTMKPRDARTSIDCHRNYERAVALFPYSRVSTTVSRVASQFCRKKQYTTTSPPRFRAFPITSSLIDTSLPLRIIYQLSLCLPFPSLPFHTRIRTNRLPPPCFPRSPLCILPLFLSTVLSLYLSISLYRSIVRFDLSSSRSRVGDGRT